MKQKNIFSIYRGSILLLLVLLQFSSCRKDCDGSGPSLNITNRCDFEVSLEVDIIGGSANTYVLGTGENQVFFPHETKVKIKAKKKLSLTSLKRTKNFEAKNCKNYTIDLLQNDSNILYRLDLEFDQQWD
jgi:hypothetical protein